MNVFIFGIGGTGARFLRALTYCLAADMGNLPNNVTFVPMIIDHDETNGDKKLALDAMKDYRMIRQYAYNKFAYPSNPYRSFFRPEITPLTEVGTPEDQKISEIDGFEFKFGHGAGNSTFADYLGLPALIGEKKPSAELLAALYNDEKAILDHTDEQGRAIDNPLAELQLNLVVGFRGNPNIGTVVFDKMSDNKAYQLFTRKFNPAQDCVVVIGSIFGGTGSSGVPKLVEAIRSNADAAWRHAKVAGILVQPYFKVNTPQGQAAAIHDNIFKSKQKAALSYYDAISIGNTNLNGMFDALYYVAEDTNMQTSYDYAEGKDEQRNPANIVELIGATGVIDFVSKQLSDIPLNKFNEYGLAKSAVEGDEITTRYLAPSEYVKDGRMASLIRFALMAKYYKDFLVGNRVDAATNFYNDNGGLGLASRINTGFYAELTKFVDGFKNWVIQMGDARRKFMPFAWNAADLNTFVNGFAPGDGGIWSSGVSFKEFTSFARRAFTSGNPAPQNFTNKDQAFLKTMYNAADEELKITLSNPKK